MWNFIDSKTSRPLQPRVLEINGERKTQAELCEMICNLLEKGSPVSFISAPGSGKTLIAICALMCIAREAIETGKPIAGGRSSHAPTGWLRGSRGGGRTTA